MEKEWKVYSMSEFEQVHVSVIITAKNEESNLIGTVADCWDADPKPHEIIVLDDCSDEPVQGRLDSFPDVKIIRPDSQLGIAGARRLAVKESTGDLIVILDSHMRMPYGWLNAVIDAHLDYPTAIFCTCCQGYDYAPGKFVGCGAEFARNKIGPDRRWLTRGHSHIVDRCPLVLGACYIIPRTVWSALNGINPNYYGWGRSEEDLSLRAWSYGFEVRRINKLVVAHRFGRGLTGSFLNTWQPAFNMMVLCATVFEDGVFEESFEPFLTIIADERAVKRFNRERENIMAFREEVQRNRMYSDREVEALTGYRIPTPDQQRTVLDRMQREKRAKEREARERKLAEQSDEQSD